MSEVKRYWIHWNDQLYAEDKNGDLVMAADFDRVTAERDALRNEIGQVNGEYDRAVNKVDALQALLTAADERADVLEGLLAKYYSRSDVCAFMAKDIDAALKPADGGGDHVKHYECIGKGGDYTVVAIAQGAGTLKGFNHYVYKNADGVHFVRDPEDFLSRMQIRP